MSQTGSIAREIEKHKRMREPEGSHGLGPDGDEASVRGNWIGSFGDRTDHCTWGQCADSDK